MEENKKEGETNQRRPIGVVFLVGIIASVASVLIIGVLCDKLFEASAVASRGTGFAKFFIWCMGILIGFPIKWVGKGEKLSFGVIGACLTLVSSLIFTSVWLDFNGLTILFCILSAIVGGLISIGLADLVNL